MFEKLRGLKLFGLNRELESKVEQTIGDSGAYSKRYEPEKRLVVYNRLESDAGDADEIMKRLEDILNGRVVA